MKASAAFFACLLLSGLGSPQVVAAETEVMVFDILDGDKPAGQVTFRLHRDGEDLVVEREQDMSVSRMMVKARITQKLEERWSGDRFVSLDSETASDTSIGDSSDKLQVKAGADGKLKVDLNGKPGELPAGTLPLSLWSRDRLRSGNYFDLSTGKLTVVQMKPAAGAAAMSYAGQACSADALDMVSADQKRAQLLIWFAPNGRPCGFNFKAERGEFRYLRRPA